MGCLFPSLVVLMLVFAYLAYRSIVSGDNRSVRVMTWLRDSSAHPEWTIEAGVRCG